MVHSRVRPTTARRAWPSQLTRFSGFASYVSNVRLGDVVQSCCLHQVSGQPLLLRRNPTALRIFYAGGGYAGLGPYDLRVKFFGSDDDFRQFTEWAM